MSDKLKPGYKQTEVGVIPEDWGVVTISDIAQIFGRIGFRGYTVNDIVEAGNGAIAINPSNIRDGEAIFEKCTYITWQKYEESPEIIIYENDIVLVKTGSTVGKTAMIKYLPERATLNPQVVVFKKLKATPGFFAYMMAFPTIQSQIKESVVGGALPTLSQRMVSAFKLPLPPPKEQRAIAEALGDVDALLGGLERLIAKKRDLKQAAMQQLLTGQTRLPGFTGEWETKLLGDILEKIVGGGTPSRANPAFWGNEIPWVTVKDFATFNPRHTQESITRLGLRNSASHLIPAGTLITSTRMALGNAVIYEVDVAINQDLKALFLKPDTSVVFLNYWFEYFGCLIDELGSGSTVKGISLVELRRFPFHVPQLPEQSAIAAVLTDMDAEIAALEARRDKTRALKQGMMQELLTGRIRLV